MLQLVPSLAWYVPRRKKDDIWLPKIGTAIWEDEDKENERKKERLEVRSKKKKADKGN